jgi:hypothetical protein
VERARGGGSFFEGKKEIILAQILGISYNNEVEYHTLLYVLI